MGACERMKLSVHTEQPVFKSPSDVVAYLGSGISQDKILYIRVDGDVTPRLYSLLSAPIHFK